MIKITQGWIDTAGRTRTWALIDSREGKLAEVTTKRAAYALKARLEAQQTGTEATFVLCLAYTTEGWALIDSTGRVRAVSLNPAMLAENASLIGDALIEAAQMTSRLADLGVVVNGSVAWAVRA